MTTSARESTLKAIGMSLAVPFNQDMHLFSCLEPFAESVSEVFVPVPLDIMGTFRAWNGPDPAEYRAMVPAIVARAHQLGIAVNMAMNAAYVPLSEHGHIADYVRVAADEGVSSFTIGDLHLATAVRDKCPDILIVVSATADVGHVTRARQWIRQAGVGRIVPSRIVNKDLRVLRALAGLGVPIELIVNEQCIPACPYAYGHSVTIGAKNTCDDSDFLYYSRTCAVIKENAPWDHYQTEVVPASVPRLQGLVHLIKLAGRDSTTAYIVEEVRRYCELESDRNRFLGGYVEPAEVFDRVSDCDRVCERCGYCEKTFCSANPDWKKNISYWRAHS